MSEREETGRGFKVDDRRRFSAEGELKPEFQGEQSTPPAASKADAPSGAQVESQPAKAAKPGVTPEMNFTTFVVSLSTQVLMMLGEIPDPISGEHARDLAGAQHVIDILGMLKDKTKGNLDRDEEALISSMLFDLRMKYVELARHPS